MITSNLPFSHIHPFPHTIIIDITYLISIFLPFGIQS